MPSMRPAAHVLVARCTLLYETGHGADYFAISTVCRRVTSTDVWTGIMLRAPHLFEAAEARQQHRLVLQVRQLPVRRVGQHHLQC